MIPQRILVAFASKGGGTAEIAIRIGSVLQSAGFSVDVASVDRVIDVTPYSAVIVGGGLYMMRWPRAARRFVARHADELRRRPVWMFSSGPFDDSPTKKIIPPTSSVRALMTRVGARGHVTFGGRLAPDAKGFLASRMARTRSGDWRDWDQVKTWAKDVAATLANAEVPLRAAPDRRSPRSDAVVFTAGLVLFGWVVVQMMLLRTANALQVGVLITALAIIGVALRRHQSPAPT